jgi:hypothetical protein
MRAGKERGQAKKEGRHGMGRTGIGGKGMERTGKWKSRHDTGTAGLGRGKVWDGGRHGGGGVHSYGEAGMGSGQAWAWEGMGLGQV